MYITLLSVFSDISLSPCTIDLFVLFRTILFRPAGMEILGLGVIIL